LREDGSMSETECQTKPKKNYEHAATIKEGVKRRGEQGEAHIRNWEGALAARGLGGMRGFCGGRLRKGGGHGRSWASWIPSFKMRWGLMHFRGRLNHLKSLQSVRETGGLGKKGR